MNNIKLNKFQFNFPHLTLLVKILFSVFVVGIIFYILYVNYTFYVNTLHNINSYYVTPNTNRTLSVALEQSIYLQQLVGVSNYGYNINNWIDFIFTLNCASYNLEWGVVDGVFQNVIRINNNTLTVNPNLVNHYLVIQIILENTLSLLHIPK